MGALRSFDGVGIHFVDEGEGQPVLLLHGFAADARINWVRPGVVERLVEAGFRVVAPDARGHGRSDKPHDPASYGDGAMGRDVVALIEHLGLAAPDLVGYSMGAYVAMHLAQRRSVMRRLVLAGVGEHTLRGSVERREVVAALEAEDPRTVDDPAGRAFRNFADATKADRSALAAVQRARIFEPGDLAAIHVPTLVVAAEGDTLAGAPGPLAERIPGAEAAVVPGDHLSAPTKPELADALVRFLAA